MYIRRKVFSHIQNEDGEVKLFSTTDYEMNDSKEVIRMFAEKKEEKKSRRKVALETVESDKGLKRAFLLSPIDGGGGLVGGYISKSEADKADKEGASDEEILRRAKKKGLHTGAITGAIVGGTAGLRMNGLAGAATGAIGGGALGALGGRNASSVNTKARLAKRAMKERE